MSNPFPYTSKLYNCYRIFLVCQQITKEKGENDPWISAKEVQKRLPLHYTVILRDLKTLTSLGIMEKRLIKINRLKGSEVVFKVLKDEAAFIELKSNITFKNLRK